MLTIFALISAATAAVPAPLSVDSQEQARLDKGDVVVRPPPTALDQAVGVVDIQGTAQAVWDAVFDFDARVREMRPLKSVTVYADDPSNMGVTFDLSIFGTPIVFHTRYQCEFDAGYCSYTLDPSRDHDLVSVVGSYQVYEVGHHQRLVYRSQTDSGRSVPGFVRRWLAVDSLTKQLEGIRERAQGVSGE